MTKIFVYGTLKRGECRNRFLENQKFISESKTKPLYELYTNGSYPSLVPSPEGLAVRGEIWEVDDECLKILDQVEGHPTLFERQPIELEDQDGVIAYFWKKSTDRLKKIGENWDASVISSS